MSPIKKVIYVALVASTLADGSDFITTMSNENSSIFPVLPVPITGRMVEKSTIKREVEVAHAVETTPELGDHSRLDFEAFNNLLGKQILQHTDFIRTANLIPETEDGMGLIPKEHLGDKDLFQSDAFVDTAKVLAEYLEKDLFDAEGDGKVIGPFPLRGVALFFAASWNGDSRAKTKDLAAAYGDLRRKGIEIVLVSLYGKPTEDIQINKGMHTEFFSTMPWLAINFPLKGNFDGKIEEYKERVDELVKNYKLNDNDEADLAIFDLNGKLVSKEGMGLFEKRVLVAAGKSARGTRLRRARRAAQPVEGVKTTKAHYILEAIERSRLRKSRKISPKACCSIQ